MDYFTLLNLKKEPFSNSPDPDFFYGAPQHVECLQKLELTIRLRQGMSVVIGDVGTGKTTICRQLIRKLGRQEDLVDTHLILDPAFSSAREFLITICATLGITPADDDSDRQIKEIIKNFLFDQAVEAKKIIVLLIDEGQKLPDYCLEILRELLNYETNNAKLLQIVIFAQREFRAQMEKMANFSDRVATLYRLEPLNFRETRNMIRFRLQQASDNQRMFSDLFNFWALAAIWWVTRGYPRKIVMLCSKTLISLIIQNGSRVSASLVFACTKRMTTGRGPATVKGVLALTLLVAVMVTAFTVPRLRSQLPLPTRPVDTTQQQISSSIPVTGPPLAKEKGANDIAGPDTTVAVAAPAPAPRKPVAESRTATETTNVDHRPLLGILPVQRGANLSKMVARVYGRFTPRTLKMVLAANPWIRDINTIAVGSRISFPAASQPTPPPADGRWRIRLARFDSLADAYEFVRRYPASLPPVRIIPLRTAAGALGFTVILERSHAGRNQAEKILRTLPAEYSGEIFTQWDEGASLLCRLPERGKA